MIEALVQLYAHRKERKSAEEDSRGEELELLRALSSHGVSTHIIAHRVADVLERGRTPDELRRIMEMLRKRMSRGLRELAPEVGVTVGPHYFLQSLCDAKTKGSSCSKEIDMRSKNKRLVRRYTEEVWVENEGAEGADVEREHDFEREVSGLCGEGPGSASYEDGECDDEPDGVDE